MFFDKIEILAVFLLFCLIYQGVPISWVNYTRYTDFSLNNGVRVNEKIKNEHNSYLSRDTTFATHTKLELISCFKCYNDNDEKMKCKQNPEKIKSINHSNDEESI